MRNRLSLALAFLSLALVAGGSGAQASGVCPVLGTLSDTNCNEIITFNADGSITTTLMNPTPYDGSEDTMVGGYQQYIRVDPVDRLAGGQLVWFEGDGIQTYDDSVGGAPDDTGYGGKTSSGENTSFSDYTSDTGTVVFGTSGIAAGGSAYFSLEEAPTLNLSVNNIPQNATEPDTLAVLGTALLGATAARRRNAKRRFGPTAGFACA